MTKIVPEEILKNVTLEEVMDCFFQGGIAGYASGGRYNPSLDETGGKVFTLRTDKLIYSDSYVSNGPQSGGMTIISLLPEDRRHFPLHGKKIPLWLMQYVGEELSSDKKAIEVVKEALLDAYNQHIFCGGRGQETYPFSKTGWNEMNYYNKVNAKYNNFMNFSGKETVEDRGNIIFYHTYSGKLLVPLE